MVSLNVERINFDDDINLNMKDKWVGVISRWLGQKWLKLVREDTRGKVTFFKIDAMFHFFMI